MNGSRDPNYILSQEEFHRSLDAWGTQLLGCSQGALEVRRQVDGLRKTAGWFCVSLALWLLMIAVALLTASERGRPR